MIDGHMAAEVVAARVAIYSEVALSYLPLELPSHPPNFFEKLKKSGQKTH